MKLQFQQNTIIYGSQLKHIWSNGPCENAYQEQLRPFG